MDFDIQAWYCRICIHILVFRMFLDILVHVNYLLTVRF
jgi:hypothetical protein